MKQLLLPHWLFGISGLLFLVLALAIGGQLEMNRHDTYYIIQFSHIGLMVFMMQVFYAVVYFILRRYLIFAAGIFHFLLATPLLIFIYVFIIQNIQTNINQSTPYFNEGYQLFTYICLFIGGQLFFLINSITAILKWTKIKSSNN